MTRAHSVRLAGSRRCGLDGPQLPWGWTVNEIPSTPWPQYAAVSPPPASGEPSGEARKGRTACRRLGAPSRHLPSSSSAQSTVASVCALARTRDAARAGSAPAGGRPPWRSIPSQGLCALMSAPHEGTRRRPLRIWRGGRGRSRRRGGDRRASGGPCTVAACWSLVASWKEAMR